MNSVDLLEKKLGNLLDELLLEVRKDRKVSPQPMGRAMADWRDRHKPSAFELGYVVSRLLDEISKE